MEQVTPESPENKEKKSKRETNSLTPNRRSLIKGLAGAPLILSMASRPVWATKCSVSGHLSGDLSNHHANEQCTYNSFSPGAFKPSNGHWYSYFWTGYYFLSPYKLTDDISVLLPSETSGKTILQALEDGPGPLRQATAAALNAYIWEKLVALFNLGQTADPAYQEITSKGYFFPFTLAEVRANYSSNPDYYSSWDIYQNID